MNPFLVSAFGSSVRWGLTLLAARGLATDSEQRQITDALVLLLTLGWSIWHKYQVTK
jgi:hypothetical protein